MNRTKKQQLEAHHRINTGVVSPAWILTAPGDPPRRLPTGVAPAEPRWLVRHRGLAVRHRRLDSSPLLPVARRKLGALEPPEDHDIAVNAADAAAPCAIASSAAPLKESPPPPNPSFSPQIPNRFAVNPPARSSYNVAHLTTNPGHVSVFGPKTTLRFNLDRD